MILISAAALAMAATPSCEPLTPDGFKVLVSQDQRALTHDDLLAHASIYQQLTGGVPCLTGVVPVGPWADELVDIAVVHHVLGQPWQDPLATALAIQPAVKHDFGPPDVRAGVPAASRTGTLPLVDGATYYLDGVMIAAAPAHLPGPHVVQRVVGGRWTSAFVVDGDFPSAWIARFGAVEPSPWTLVSPSRTIARFGVIAGYGQASQRVDTPGDWLADVSRDGATVGVVTDGAVDLHAPVGLAWDAEVPLQLGAGVGGDAYAGLAFMLPFGTIAVEGGATGARVWTGSTTALRVLPQPNLALWVGQPNSRLEAGLQGGWTPAAAHARASAAVVFGRFAIGVDGGFRQGAFLQTDTARSVATIAWEAALRAELRWSVSSH